VAVLTPRKGQVNCRRAEALSFSAASMLHGYRVEQAIY
jgi:hypothetical protein